MNKAKNATEPKKKSGTIITVSLIIILILGLSLLLYPSVSNYWNSFRNSRAVANYAESVANLENEEYNRLLAEAHDYNSSLRNRSNIFTLSDEERERYEKVLNVSDTGILGYVEIPSIDCTAPIYRGTQENVLQIAVGHLEWTSVPVGGLSTHCVISGHRGLPSARLFTDLDKMKEGDIFMIRVLDETLTYQVDKISIVEPADVSSLLVEEGKDYCSLVTCTPYAINTHRLIVRGTRIDNIDVDSIRVTADAMKIEPLVVMPFVATPILIFLLILLLVSTRRSKR